VTVESAAFLLIKLSLRGFSPVELTCARLALGAAFLTIVVLATKLRLPTGRRVRLYLPQMRASAATRRSPTRFMLGPRFTKACRVMDRWLVETVQSDLAPKTAENYELFTGRYIQPDLGAKRL
jgi:hypothetical protein